MSTRVSRRAVFASVTASALAKPAQEAPPASPDEELKATLSAQRAAFERVRKVELPMAVEPAAVFKP